LYIHGTGIQWKPTSFNIFVNYQQKKYKNVILVQLLNGSTSCRDTDIIYSIVKLVFIQLLNILSISNLLSNFMIVNIIIIKNLYNY